MKYSLLFALLFFQFSSLAQKIIKPTKKDPPGTVRMTDYEFLTPTKTEIFGFGATRFTFEFRVLETDSATIQLCFRLECGHYDVKKGEPIKVYFIDSSMVTLYAVKDAPTTGYRESLGQAGAREHYYANMYIELSKKLQQTFINKEVESVRMAADFLHLKVDKKKRGLIRKALQLFN